MYKAFMYHGQDSPEYSEMVEQRTEAARKQLEFYSKGIALLESASQEDQNGADLCSKRLTIIVHGFWPESVGYQLIIVHFVC